MFGVPHRSLARSVRASSFRGLETWNDRADVPEPAVDEFTDADDPETSLWTDGEDASRRIDLLLSLTFKRPSIGKLSLAMLWQDDERVGTDLGRRIVQSDGDTPYVPARPLHYHVTEPRTEDYRDLAFASGRRELLAISGEKIRELIEEAFVTRSIPTEGLGEHLQDEIRQLLQRRFVDSVEVRASPTLPIFDIRAVSPMEQKIRGAQVVREADLAAVLHRAKIGKGDAFVIYCQDGNESLRVARTLRGLQKAPRVLVGGINEWLSQGFEVETA